MNLIATSRVSAALSTALVYAGICAYPQQRIASRRLRQEDGWPSDYRNGMARVLTDQGIQLIAMLSHLLDLTVEIRAPKGMAASIPGSSLVICNHRTHLDVPMMCVVMHHLGKPNIRWIAKEETRRFPFVWAGEQSHYGFVSRENPQQDLERIRACAEDACMDESSIIIFPEGTRFRGPVKDSSLKHLRPPKQGGFQSLRTNLPAGPVISVTIDWRSEHKRQTGDNRPFDIFDLVGSRAIIHAELIDASTIDRDPLWLERHWTDKDRLIEETRSSLATQRSDEPERC